LRRAIVKHQAHLFFPMLLLQAATRFHSIAFLLSKRARFPVIESSFMAAHFLIYLWLRMLAPRDVAGVAFILVHQTLFGLYRGCTLRRIIRNAHTNGDNTLDRL
jgi:hypothetical protein